MNKKHQKTLKAIFANPVSAAIIWADIERLFLAVGAKRFMGHGSRVRFIYEDKKATFHRPHPGKEAKEYQVKDARVFLENIGVKP